jgi:spore coat polysaccharide biosynthesis predicted glycosyltransferase SpsG
LHRTQWLHEALSSQSGAGQIEIWCEQTPTARSHFENSGIQPAWHPDPVSGWLAQQQGNSGRGYVCVLDWLDSLPDQVVALRSAGAAVVLLDDYGPAQAEADLVINCLLAPLSTNEFQLGRARFLSGADYVQLPPQAIKLRGVSEALTSAMQLSGAVAAVPDRVPKEVLSVLISAGGTESGSDTDMLLLPALEMAGYTGQVYVKPGRFEQSVRRSSGKMIVQELPAGPDFHDLLASADLALLAGGLTLYEACFLGVPTLCIPRVAHQAATAQKLSRTGCCAALPSGLQARLMGTEACSGSETAELAELLRPLIEQPELRGRLSAAGLRCFDGLGLQRTALAILELAAGHMA